MTLPGVDLLDPALVADPYPAFAELRRHDPVHWSNAQRAWLVTRYADVTAGFRDPRLSADRVMPFYEDRLDPAVRTEIEPLTRVLAGWMVFKDPPDHTRLRRLVQQAFTTRAVVARRPMIERVVGDLLDDLAARDRDRPIDLVARFASQVPAIVIAEMLGVPPGDRDRFQRWSDDLAALVFGAQGDDHRRVRAGAGLGDLAAYLGELVDARRRQPAGDLITALVRAEEEDDDALSADEVVSTCALLLFAGYETTTSLIANGTLALLRHPDQLDALRTDPGLGPTAVEELLRYDGPTKIDVRWVTSDNQMHERTIRRGDRVFLVAAAANRDPDEFADPDRLDLARTPNPHMGFGYGLHHCLGAPLARLEATVALAALAARFPGLALAGDPADLPWKPQLVSRMVARLPVTLGR